MIELVLGGARSGKSRYAENCVLAKDKTALYLATADALDDEMQQRIRHHQSRRMDEWLTVEETIHLAEALKNADSRDRCILVDCLTLWLSNCLLKDRQCWPQQKAALLQCLPAMQADVVLVSNEVGQGIVPLGEINRRFVDESGWLHQELAALADSVTLVTAGLPFLLKSADCHPE